jgi:glutamyl-tRNA synthetase
MPSTYVGRLAPSPTGLLHLGHARTFWFAWRRARQAQGRLYLRNDDLDRNRCRPGFVEAMVEDLRWLGLDWDGPMVTQSERLPRYRAALVRLHAGGWIFPCDRSRKDVLEAAAAPHEGGPGDEPVYPTAFRPPAGSPLPPLEDPIRINWRFRVPDGETIVFRDADLGEQRAVAGRDFGDFLVWRRDDLPSYQLACAVDDHDMGVTEVVRGADLVMSTFRQHLIARALGWQPVPTFHCALVTDERGERLAKRHDALSLRTLRERGVTPAEILRDFAQRFP